MLTSYFEKKNITWNDWQEEMCTDLALRYCPQSSHWGWRRRRVDRPPWLPADPLPLLQTGTTIRSYTEPSLLPSIAPPSCRAPPSCTVPPAPSGGNYLAVSTRFKTRFRVSLFYRSGLKFPCVKTFRSKLWKNLKRKIDQTWVHFHSGNFFCFYSSKTSELLKRQNGPFETMNELETL